MLYISVPGRTGWEEERKEDLKGGTERMTGGRPDSGGQDDERARTMRGVQEDLRVQEDGRTKTMSGGRGVEVRKSAQRGT